MKRKGKGKGKEGERGVCKEGSGVLKRKGEGKGKERKGRGVYARKIAGY